jgi:hypothetical protein
MNPLHSENRWQARKAACIHFSALSLRSQGKIRQHSALVFESDCSASRATPCSVSPSPYSSSPSSSLSSWLSWPAPFSSLTVRYTEKSRQIDFANSVAKKR